jgi:glycosyltransferase involved in cell wall biosynthesis
MRILVDFTQIPVNKVGVGVYAYNTFRTLIKSNLNHEYFILIQDDDPDFISFENDGTTILKVKSGLFRIFTLRILLEQFYIPFLCIKNKIDILHSLHYSIPLFIWKTKRVVTFHDLTFYLYPEYHTKIKVLYFRLFIYLSTIFSDIVISVSKSTANDLLTKFPKSKTKVRVIPLAVSDNAEFKTFNTEDVFNKYNINKKYILYVGTLEPRKNICSLLQAYKILLNKNDEYLLVIAGRKGWFYESIFLKAKGLEIEDKVIFTGFISEIVKEILLSNCSIFVYPSFYEGFGLPVLEAMSKGIPTITSNISSMPEVVGDSAILIDPYNVNQLSDEMINLLNNENLRKELSIKSKLRASTYSWDQTARLTLEAYDSLL